MGGRDSRGEGLSPTLNLRPGVCPGRTWVPEEARVARVEVDGVAVFAG